MVDAGNRSAVTSLKVIEELSLTGGAGVSELARRLDLAKSTVQRTLITLKQAGWARQDSSARWSLTLRCAVVSQRVMTRTTVSDVVRPIIMELRDQTGETIRCFLIEDLNIVLLDVAESDHAVRAVEEKSPGSLPLHATAIGKALLALRPEVLSDVLNSSLEPVTAKTLSKPELLRKDIEQAQRQGWAQVSEETNLGVGGVAAAADLGSGVMIGMGITYPLHRASEADVKRYGELAAEFTQRAAHLAGPRILDGAR